ncbi:hypothetical protein L6164_036620 [Bauhinia variegata]|uniref:Uncharacterized protein n=1 Tax=Bauhinia variegata TaxID=167791 RepID=A0ACB9KHH2_BAUVA|nr:hypothetical protein L6164_036620 [Bauhinia variegata]
MASLTPTLPPSVNIVNLSSTSSISSLPIWKKKSHAASKHGKPNHYYASRVSCKATDDDMKKPISPQNGHEQEAHLGMFDRRNILLGLGGIYGAAATTLGNNPFARAAEDCNDKPILAPEFSSCHLPNDLPSKPRVTNCCPPNSKDFIHFSDHLKYTSKKVRARRPAHILAYDKEYVSKFERAIAEMKKLPPEDPRSFVQQAKIHCAYCNGGYPQSPTNDKTLQVHFSWLFPPFHRWYLYFFERILAELIDDPTFAIPFWNWDDPDGMHMPIMYADNIDSPLYDCFRNRAHVPPKFLDLNYSRSAGDILADDITLTNNNLKILHTRIVDNNTPELFLGKCYHLGSEASRLHSGAGSLEIIHNTLHAWVGDPFMPNNEDMGNFYSSGFDTLFYAHHANVDRLWSVWKELDGGTRTDFTCKDWLNTEFIFYDQKKIPVKVTVAECLSDEKDLFYKYEGAENTWKDPNNRPTGRLPFKGANATTTLPSAPAAEDITSSVVLDSAKKFLVKRPTAKRGDNQNEILVIEGIEFPTDKFVKFDILINDDDADNCTPASAEFADFFTNVPHGKSDQTIKTKHTTNITELLKILEVSDDDKTILVTLVPRDAGEKVKVGGVKIEYAKVTAEIECL